MDPRHTHLSSFLRERTGHAFAHGIARPIRRGMNHMSGVRVPPSARSRQGHAPTDPHMVENAARRTGPCSLKLIVPKRYSIFIYAVRNVLVRITGVEPVCRAGTIPCPLRSPTLYPQVPVFPGCQRFVTGLSQVQKLQKTHAPSRSPGDGRTPHLLMRFCPHRRFPGRW